MICNLGSRFSTNFCVTNLEVVSLQQLIQVDPEQLKGDAEMVSEVEVLPHVHQVILVISILRFSII